MSIYQPFLDHAKEVMGDGRLSDLEDYPIPAGYERNEATVGKGKREAHVVTTSHGFRSKKLRQIRAAHVDGGVACQVLNFVIFPDLNYDLPFFGADLVTLPGGPLIAIDMQPLFHTPEYRARYSDPVMPIFDKYKEDLPWGGDFPEEAKAYFSPAFLWTRPTAPDAVETHVFGAFKDYLNAYLDLVKAAEPVTDRQKLDEIRDAQLSYVNYRSEKDPARGMLTRFYGSEWTEEYIHGFLFDLERKLAIAA